MVKYSQQSFHRHRRFLWHAFVLVMLVVSIVGGIPTRSVRATGPATLVKTINDVANMTGETFEFNGKHYFFIETTTNYSYVDLWQSDGTSAGTQLFQKSVDGNFIIFNGMLYFFKCDSTTYICQLMKSDGSVVGTEPIKTFNAYDFFDNLQIFNNKIIFTAEWWLYSSDGTAAGTIALKHLRTGSFAECTYPIRDFTPIGGSLFFKVCDEYDGLKIFKTDGTIAGTTQVGNNIPISYGREDSFPMVIYNGLLYITGHYHWQLNPTNGVMTRLDWLGCRYQALHIWKNSISCLNRISSGSYPTYTVTSTLIMSNGSQATTRSVKSWVFSDGIRVNHINPDRLFMSISDINTGHQLWTSDGTTAGTQLLKTLTTSYDSSFYWDYPDRYMNGLFYFTVPSEATGYELWRSDGTSAGTIQLHVFPTLTASTTIRSLRSINGITFLEADDGVHGNELWRTDGTAAGTFLVNDFTAGSEGSNIGYSGIDGTLLLTTRPESARYTATGQLWATDLIHSEPRLIQEPINGFVRLWNDATNLYYIDLNATTSTAELWKLPLSAVRTSWQVAVSPQTGGTINYTSPSGNKVTLTIPAGAVSQPTTLVLTPTPTPSTTPPYLAFAGTGFMLDAYQGTTKLDTFNFQAPITAAITYTNQQINGFAESTLKLYYEHSGTWIDAATSCSPTSVYQRDMVNNRLSVDICHLTPFALFGSVSSDTFVYLPMVIR